MSQAAYRILADDEDVTAAIAARFLRLQLSDERDAYADTLEIDLDDRRPAIATPRRGVVLSVAIGVDGLTERGRFTVDEIERSGPVRTLVIHAQATDIREELKQERTFAWEATTLGQVISDVAKRHGLTPRVSDALTGRRVPRLDQTNESDKALLQRLGRDFNTQPKITDEFIVFVEKGQGQSAAGVSLPTVYLTPKDVTTWQESTQDRGRHGSVVARWYSTALAAEQTVTIGEGLPRKTLGTVYDTEERATDAARSELIRLNRGTGPLQLTLPGRSDLRAETPLQLSGFGPDVDGAWVVDNLRESVDKAKSWTMTVEASPPKQGDA